MYSYSSLEIVGYIGTFWAPICKIPISSIFHSVLLEEEITAILSFGFTPNRSNPRLIALAWLIYSSVEVDTHLPLYFEVKAFSDCTFLIGNLGCQTDV